eukprot:scaffold2774_cov87-Phaeocystis_antarctica.AAC.10
MAREDDGGGGSAREGERDRGERCAPSAPRAAHLLELLDALRELPGAALQCIPPHGRRACHAAAPAAARRRPLRCGRRAAPAWRVARAAVARSPAAAGETQAAPPQAV